MASTKKVQMVREYKGVKTRFEACFSGLAYAPHRHDTYTLALTVSGVQSFNYRGQMQHSLPGQVVILHPDELHDGQAGTDTPFCYKAINISPTEIQQVLGGGPLPFIESGVSLDARLLAVAKGLLGDMSQTLVLNQYEDSLFEFANSLHLLSSGRQGKSTPNFQAAALAKTYLDDCIFDEVGLDELAQVAQFSKWQLSRDFRLVFGTSPHRYQILRRLNQAKQMITEQLPLADIALACGFADQAHFSRQFKAAFGLTPKQWQLSLS